MQRLGETIWLTFSLSNASLTGRETGLGFSGCAASGMMATAIRGPRQLQLTSGKGTDALTSTKNFDGCFDEQASAGGV